MGTHTHRSGRPLKHFSNMNSSRQDQSCSPLELMKSVVAFRAQPRFATISCLLTAKILSQFWLMKEVCAYHKQNGDSFSSCCGPGGQDLREHVIFANPAVAEKGSFNLRIDLSTPGGHSSVPPPHTVRSSTGSCARHTNPTLGYRNPRFADHRARSPPTRGHPIQECHLLRRSPM